MISLVTRRTCLLGEDQSEDNVEIEDEADDSQKGENNAKDHLEMDEDDDPEKSYLGHPSSDECMGERRSFILTISLNLNGQVGNPWM